MDFEFDSEKSISNTKKHGISFEAAKQLWQDQNLIEVPAKNIDEPRFLFIGRIRNTYWSAITTYRDSVIRIISVRRARPKEIALYENE